MSMLAEKMVHNLSMAGSGRFFKIMGFMPSGPAVLLFLNLLAAALNISALIHWC
jgi:hypothetical protein